MRLAVFAAAFAASAVALGADFTLYNIVPFSSGREDVAAADAKSEAIAKSVASMCRFIANPF